MDGHITTHNLGYPRIGEKRELKKATEAYWRGEIAVAELEEVGRNLRKAHWLAQKEAGIELIPSNDFSFYDQMLDMTCLLGNIPPRFAWNGESAGLDICFQIARGGGEKQQTSIHPSEMTKWFDTNYHYIVPEFQARDEVPAEWQQALRRVYGGSCAWFSNQAGADRTINLPLPRKE